MTRQFCDRCGADVTRRRSASVTVVGDADAAGNGTETDRWDLCPKCLESLRTWIAHSFERRPKR